MHVRQKRNRSGSVSVVVVDKAGGRYREVHTVGIAREEWEIEEIVKEGREWIRLHKLERQPELDLYGEERRALESEESASKRFAHEIHSNKPLLAALQATGYSRPRKILSPKQLQIIFSFLGEP